MKVKTFAAACLLAIAAPAMAAGCSRVSIWGDLTLPSARALGNEFGAAQAFNDCYTFNLSANALGVGGVIELDPIFNRLDIDVSMVSLYSAGGIVGQDASPGSFQFDDLAAGAYTLAISGQVAPDGGFYKSKVGYFGAFGVAAPVPEPETYAMLLAGFFGVGFGVLRRKKA